MADLDVFKEDFALLFEAGMVAIKQGMKQALKRYFKHYKYWILSIQHMS